ncbi:MAG: hypothetical protein RIE52_13395 [Balneola sp.]|jgi:hypothetical protein
MIPKLNKAIQNGQLQLTETLIPYPAFNRLLQVLQINAITFNQVEIEQEKEENILVKGESYFLDLPLQKADFYLYKEKENDYEFEWHGTLASVSFKTLYEKGIMASHPLNLLPELLNGMFEEIDVLFSSHDQAFAIEAFKSDIELPFSSIGFSLTNIGFYYERSLNKSIPARYELTSTIQIGSTLIATALELPAGNRFDPVCWSLKTTEMVVLKNGLQDAVHFLSGHKAVKEALGKSFMDLIPNALHAIPEFALTKLALHINPKKPALQLIDFSIQSLGKLEIVPEFSIKNIGVGTFITFHENTPACTLSLFGNFYFSPSIAVDFYIQLPLNKQDDWIIHLEGYADIEKLQNLEKLPFIKLQDLNLPKEWLAINDIRLDHLEIVFNPLQQKIKSVEFELALNAKSSLIPGISVKNPELAFTLTF